jgi:hypothetical protein
MGPTFGRVHSSVTMGGIWFGRACHQPMKNISTRRGRLEFSSRTSAWTTPLPIPSLLVFQSASLLLPQSPRVDPNRASSPSPPPAVDPDRAPSLSCAPSWSGAGDEDEVWQQRGASCLSQASPRGRSWSSVRRSSPAGLQRWWISMSELHLHS